jgi:hypothetical protein
MVLGVQVIEDLASEGRLNGQTFCIQCMVGLWRFLNVGEEVDRCRIDRRGNHSARNIVAYATSALLGAISKFCPWFLLVFLMMDCSHCPWVWNCGG